MATGCISLGIIHFLPCSFSDPAESMMAPVARWISAHHKPCLPPISSLQSERADPYLLAGLRDNGLLPDPLKGPDVCGNLPKSHRPLLNNIHVERSYTDEKPKPGMRVMCMILTYSKKHDNNLEAVRQTWGRHCHGFVAFSNMTDPNIPSIQTPAFGGERYTNTWQKMRALWKYTWFHYSNEFDWFLKADDDVYVIWENLMEYLGSKEVQAEREKGDGVFLGRRFWLEGKKEKLYNSGGAGYLLDRKALGELAGNLDTKECDVHGQHQWEDLFAGMCLRQAGVIPFDTRDDRMRHRFMPMRPANHYSSRPQPPWYPIYSASDGNKTGLDCCSRRTITFHYQPKADMLQTHRYLYKCRDDAEATDS